MYWNHGFFGVDLVWVFILLVVVVAAISRVIRSHEREKTIRAAIDKGVTLDPATLGSLRAPRVSNPQDARTGLLTGAIVTFFVGLGLAAMGYVLSMDGDAHAFRGLAGVGALLWCISLGLFVARFAVAPRDR